MDVVMAEVVDKTLEMAVEEEEEASVEAGEETIITLTNWQEVMIQTLPQKREYIQMKNSGIFRDNKNSKFLI